jgi:hypothetical protein
MNKGVSQAIPSTFYKRATVLCQVGSLLCDVDSHGAPARDIELLIRDAERMLLDFEPLLWAEREACQNDPDYHSIVEVVDELRQTIADLRAKHNLKAPMQA